MCVETKTFERDYFQPKYLMCWFKFEGQIYKSKFTATKRKISPFDYGYTLQSDLCVLNR